MKDKTFENRKPLSTKPTKWSDTLKQFVGKFPMNCLGVFEHFVRLALKGLTHFSSLFPFGFLVFSGCMKWNNDQNWVNSLVSGIHLKVMFT